METTSDLAYFAKHARRDVLEYKAAVANDNLCIVHKQHLIDLEDQNDFLLQTTQLLKDEVASLQRRLARAESANASLEIRNAELHFVNQKLQTQKTAMQCALKEVNRANAAFQAAADENFATLIPTLDEKDGEEAAIEGV